MRRSGRPFGTHLELECALEQRLRLLVVRGALGEADAAVRRHGMGGERRGLAHGGAEDAEGFGHVARRERELVQLLVDLNGGGACRGIARRNCAENCAENCAGRTLPIDMCALAMIDESTVAWPLVCSFW